MGERINKAAFFKSKAFIITISLVLIAAAAAVIYLSAFRPSAKEAYLKAESRNFKTYSEKIKKAYKEFYDENSPYTTERNRVRREITLSVSTGAGELFGVKNPQDIFDIVKKLKLIVDVKSDPTTGNGVTNASLLLEKAPLLDAAFFTEGRRSGFTVPAFTPGRYFVYDNDKLSEVYDRFGIPVKLKKLIGPADFVKTIKFSDTEWDKTASEYGEILAASISDRSVALNGTASNKYGLKGRKFTVALDTAATQKMINELAQKTSSDPGLKDLTYGNYAGVMNLIGDMGVLQAFDMLNSSGVFSLNEVITGLIQKMAVTDGDAGFSKLVAELGTLSFPEGLKMEVIADNSGILERKATLAYKRSDGTGGSLVFEGAAGDSRRDITGEGYISIKLTDNKDSNPIEQSIKITSSGKAGDKNNGKRTDISFDTRRGGKLELGVKAGFDSQEVPDELTGAKNSLVKYNIEFSSDDTAGKDVLSGEIKSNYTKNNKTRVENTSTIVLLRVDMPSFDLGQTEFKVGIATEKRLGIETFKLPDLSGQKVTDLYTASDTGLKQAEDEALASLGAFYLSNKPLVDALGGTKK